ncbi:LysR substrate-binding domain-containing protein [Streptomyces narbonensis]
MTCSGDRARRASSIQRKVDPHKGGPDRQPRGPLLRVGRSRAGGPRAGPAPPGAPGRPARPHAADPQEALAEVARGDADVAVVVRPREDPAPGLRLVRLLDDEYLVALPPGHPLAARRVLDLADLADEPWVGSEPQGPCLDVVLGACSAAGFSPDFVAGSEDYATALGFVAAGLGVGLVPRLGTGGRRMDVVLRKVRNPRRSGPSRRPSARGRPATPPSPRCSKRSPRRGDGPCRRRTDGGHGAAGSRRTARERSD